MTARRLTPVPPTASEAIPLELPHVDAPFVAIHREVLASTVRAFNDAATERDRLRAQIMRRYVDDALADMERKELRKLRWSIARLVFLLVAFALVAAVIL